MPSGEFFGKKKMVLYEIFRENWKSQKLMSADGTCTIITIRKVITMSHLFEGYINDKRNRYRK